VVDNRKYHREKVGKRRRYVSAFRQYSLASPFTERCFQLATSEGYVGLITSNNFMKREFGKPLIQKILAKRDLTLVVDTSQAYIPFHGTPTALLFARNRRPQSEVIRAVMGKRGESGTPDDPARGRVWVSIEAGWNRLGFENEYVSVSEVARATLSRHPWSLKGGGASELKVRVESEAKRQLGQVSSAIGRTTVCGEDPVFMVQLDAAARFQAGDLVRPLTIGEVVRDWAIMPTESVIYPYATMGGLPVDESHPVVGRHFWRFRTLLKARSVFGKSTEERGGAWYEHLEHYADRLRTPLSIAFAFVATHNHFVLDRGGKVFNRSAPVIKLPPEATEDDHLALLGLLNSSTACFWMKQVFHPKGMTSANRNHPDPARMAHEFAATGLKSFPVPDFDQYRHRLVSLARRLDDYAQRRSHLLDARFVDALVAEADDAASVLEALRRRWSESDVLRERMVALQEELDWIAYVAFGLCTPDCLIDHERYGELTCPRGARPFERLGGRTSTVRAGGRAVALGEAEVPPVGSLPAWAEPVWRRREAAIGASDALELIEGPVYKRAWRDTEQNVTEPDYRKAKDEEDLRLWVCDRVETWASKRTALFTVAQLTAALQDDGSVHRVAGALSRRADYSLERLLAGLVTADAVPSHPLHTYTESGLEKRAAWERVWELQRREDAGERVGEIPVPPEYSQGSRGKSRDFTKNEYWGNRGKLDVPKERFIAFTEVPGRDGARTLYGWAGWTPVQRVRAMLALDETLEEEGLALSDRIALLDSAWRLLPDVARDDAAAASRLKAEMQALVGAAGPSAEMLAEWREEFPPPGGRGRARSGRRSRQAGAGRRS
jgi:hypothetical protein